MSEEEKKEKWSFGVVWSLEKKMRVIDGESIIVLEMERDGVESC